MNILKSLREEKRLSQKQLGELLGLSESTICLYEKGKRKPKYDTLMKMASLYDTTVDALLRKIGNNTDADFYSLQKKMKEMSPENRKKLLEFADNL